ncbi:superinfection immunity protein [Providencia heimbachae]|uniref:superinfection immunity protein n=1 Tax=Providencia heimbachae TaxID=333962 RepID=UPI00223ECEFA|nr:superinfection immunity protein [Providencia heimbachae]
MGQIPAHSLNSFGRVVSLSFFIAAPLLYVLPAIEAKIKSHSRFNQILVVNILLGWTLIGWVVAYVWALGGKDENSKSIMANVNLGVGRKKTKQCPYCAEDILEAAIKCKHCGSDIPPKD